MPRVLLLTRRQLGFFVTVGAAIFAGLRPPLRATEVAVRLHGVTADTTLLHADADTVHASQ